MTSDDTGPAPGFCPCPRAYRLAESTVMMVASGDDLLSTRTFGGLTRSSASADDHSFQSLCSGECDENAGGLTLVPIILARRTRPSPCAQSVRY
jgi:hypothetical protein